MPLKFPITLCSSSSKETRVERIRPAKLIALFTRLLQIQIS